MYWLSEGYELLDPDKERKLISKYKANKSNAVRDKIIESNYGLIIDAIKRYEKIYSLNSSDLFQEGLLGLYTALEKYDVTRGYKFSTYAINWINMAILTYNLGTIGDAKPTCKERRQRRFKLPRRSSRLSLQHANGSTAYSGN